MHPDFRKAAGILDRIYITDRNSLLEHEVYEFLDALTIGDIPKFQAVEKIRISSFNPDLFPGEKVVLKIIHPDIIHKSDASGVKIIPKAKIGNDIEKILLEAPAGLAKILSEKCEIPAGLTSDQFTRNLHDKTWGILVMEFIETSPGFGHELFLGMRVTREFGPVINIGLGGVDTELFAGEFPKGRAFVTVSPGISNDAETVAGFTGTIAWETLTGKARGHEGIVSADEITDIIAKFHAAVWRFSPFNPDAEYWLTEFEINPLLVRDGKFVPVDGLLRFAKPGDAPKIKPIGKIKNLLYPEKIAVIGVSAKDLNFGRVILTNLLNGAFSPDKLAVVKAGADFVDGVKCYGSVRDLPGKFDLIVLSVAASQVQSIVSEIIVHEKAESIILISSGMGEKEGGESLEKLLRELIDSSRERPGSGPLLVGGNSLGVISRPGGYDTMFVPETKLPKNPDEKIGPKVALLSQSGAFMITKVGRLAGMSPRYAISTGNQVDLGVADFLDYLSGDPEIKVFGCYVEGFSPGEGFRFTETARKLTSRGIDIVVYKGGRSAEGRRAASGHTASIAGDWDVANALLTRAGCLVAGSNDEWTDLLLLAAGFSGFSPGDGRLAAVTNAGYEAVGMADNIRTEIVKSKNVLLLPEFSEKILGKIRGILDSYGIGGLFDIHNPLDLTPMAECTAHVDVVKAIADGGDFDIIVHSCIPLSSALKPPIRPDGVACNAKICTHCFPFEYLKEKISIPMAVVFDVGSMYDEMVDKMLNSGIPVFRSADRAIRIIARWASAKKIASGKQLHPVGMI